MQTYRISLFVLASTILAAPAPARAPSTQGGGTRVTGAVFLDANGNRRRDANERGVPRVMVSDQRQLVLTDANGTYEIQGATRGVVGISVPDGYRLSGPRWAAVGDTNQRADFALVGQPAPRTFTFVHASDPHVSAQSIDRLKRVRALVDSIKPAFVLMTGDLVRDALRVGEAEARGYYQMYVDEVAKFSAPVWSVPGNHENFGIERDKSGVSIDHPLYGKGMFRSYLGPTYFSFTYGGVHFLGLDTVDYDDQSYYGHVDSAQVAWIARDLGNVPRATPVVTFDHIPFYSGRLAVDGYDATSVAPTLITVGGKTQFRHVVSNATEVVQMIASGHPYPLALGGHFHHREQLTYDMDGAPIRFFQAGAIVGPSERPARAAPSGVIVYRVTDGKIDNGTFVPLGLK